MPQPTLFMWTKSHVLHSFALFGTWKQAQNKETKTDWDLHSFIHPASPFLNINKYLIAGWALDLLIPRPRVAIFFPSGVSFSVSWVCRASHKRKLGRRKWYKHNLGHILKLNHTCEQLCMAGWRHRNKMVKYRWSKIVSWIKDCRGYMYIYTCIACIAYIIHTTYQNSVRTPTHTNFAVLQTLVDHFLQLLWSLVARPGCEAKTNMDKQWDNRTRSSFVLILTSSVTFNPCFSKGMVGNRNMFLDVFKCRVFFFPKHTCHCALYIAIFMGNFSGPKPSLGPAFLLKRSKQ